VRRADFSIFLLLALLAAPMPARANVKTQPARILLIFGHDPNSPGVVVFAQQLRATVRAQGLTQVEYYDELLDVDRLGGRERWPQLARYLTEKYKGFRLDLIVAESSMALRFATEHLSGVFPGVPVVYGAAFEPVVNFDSLPANVTGSRLPLPFAPTFALARSLQPDAERVVLVGGSSLMDSVLLAAAIRTVAPQLNGLELVVLQDWTYDSLLRNLRQMPLRSIVIFSSFRQDKSGQTFIRAPHPSVTGGVRADVRCCAELAGRRHRRRRGNAVRR
jgi:ABC-type uncharacterized transport system substrate-binding protein